MKIVALNVAACVVLAAPVVCADLHPAVSIGGGVLFTATKPYVGDAKEIGDALGGQTSSSGGVRLVPMLTESVQLAQATARTTFRLESSQRWWSVWHRFESSAPSANHALDRSVFAADLLVKGAVCGHNRRVCFIFGAGPSLYVIKTREEGWLGDDSTLHLRPGLRGFIGMRIAMSDRAAVVLDTSAEYFRVPRQNQVLWDGGNAPAGQFAARLEVGL